MISRNTWKRYITVLRKLNNKAAEDMIKRQTSLFGEVQAGTMSSEEATKLIVDYAYGVATKYGEGAATAACEMYDAIALLSGAVVPPAVPAKTATYKETAKAVYGTLKQNPEITPAAISRLVKMAGVDTTMQNAIRDGAQWAWIPSGDSCAFCMTLASQGWLPASQDQLQGGHAEHIHANCDCTFAIRFNSNTDVAGYDPDALYEKYRKADPGGSSQDKINALRREMYQKNKDEINEQKREAYQKRVEREEAE